MKVARASINLGVFALAMTLAAGCGSDDPVDPPTPGNRVPTILLTEVTNITDFVGGDAVVINATVDDADDDDLVVTWAVSGTSGGSLDQSTGESVTWTAAATPGNATITATVSDGTAQATATFNATIGTGVGDGALDAGATWTLANSPYVIGGDALNSAEILILPAGQTLTIEAGVEIRFRGKAMVGGDFSRPKFEVLGTLNAMGTSTAAGQRIRVRGGRDIAGSQHEGIIMLGPAEAVAHYVAIEDGTVGLAHRSSGSLEMFRCRLLRNNNGMECTSGASSTVTETLFSDNSGHGAFVNGGTLRLLHCTLEDNAASGLFASATQGQPTTVADVDSCVIARNDAANVTVAANAAFMSLSVNACNFGQSETADTNVNFSNCAGLQDDLEGNFWGFLADADPTSSTGILSKMVNWDSCSSEMASWTLGTEWTNTAILLPLAP